MRSSSSLDASSSRLILLVDDHSLGLAARKAVLEEAGYKVVAAASAAEALEAFSKRHFDLLVTDYRMPRMNGIELIRRIREQREDLPVILVSGVADALGLAESNTGANVVIQKSANEVTHLVRAVDRLLQRKTQRKPAGRVRGATKARRQSAS